MSSSQEKPFAGLIKDKVREALLEEDFSDGTIVLPEVPLDREDFKEDLKNAMETLSKSGSFVEETKMKFKIWRVNFGSEG